MGVLTKIFNDYDEFRKDKIYVYCELIDFISKFYAFDVAAEQAANDIIKNTSPHDRSRSIRKFGDSKRFHRFLLYDHAASLKLELDASNKYGDLKTELLEKLPHVIKAQD